MKTARLLLGLVVAGATLVVAPATPASADPIDWPYDPGDDALICNLSVAGTIVPEGASAEVEGGLLASGTSEKSYVGYSYELGWSVSFACVGHMAETGGSPIDAIGMTANNGRLVYPYVDELHAVTRPLGALCFLKSESAGIEANCPPGEAEDYVDPLLHSYKRNGQDFTFSGRFDVPPAEPICLVSSSLGAGWPFRLSQITLPLGTQVCSGDQSGIMGWVRRSQVCIVADNSISGDGMNGNSCTTLEDGNGSNTITDTGAAVPVEVPEHVPPGGPIDTGEPSGGACKIASWLLTDQDSEDKWSGTLKPKEIVLYESHTYTLRVKFTGEAIPSMTAKIRKGSHVEWQDTKFNPTSPVEFEFTGVGGKVLLFVTGFATNGDIDPECQGTITDEEENEGTSRYEDCVAAAPGITWNAPSSWVPGLASAFICAMQAVFVPEKSLSDRAEELRNESGAAQALGDGGAALSGSVAALGSPATGSCTGPGVPMPQAGTQHPFAVCEGAMSEVAYWSKMTAEFAVWVGAAIAIWNMIAGQIWGAKTIVYRPNEDGMRIDHNESGQWV